MDFLLLLYTRDIARFQVKCKFQKKANKSGLSIEAFSWQVEPFITNGYVKPCIKISSLETEWRLLHSNNFWGFPRKQRIIVNSSFCCFRTYIILQFRKPTEQSQTQSRIYQNLAMFCPALWMQCLKHGRPSDREVWHKWKEDSTSYNRLFFPWIYTKISPSPYKRFSL